jgi:Zn-dependent metalloprotease
MEERMKPLLILISLFIWTSQIQAQEQPAQTRTVAWEQFKAQEGTNWDIRWNEQTGLPRTLIGETKTKYTGVPEIAAKAFLSKHTELFAFNTNLSDLRHLKTKENRGIRHVTFQQYFEGLKVEGAQYKVHLREDGTVDMANGYYYDNIDIPIIPVISSLSASNTAMLDLELATSLFNKNTSELVIYPQNETFHLAYKIDVLVEDPFTNWQYFVDATNGRILRKYNKITPIYTAKNVTSNKVSKENTLKNKNLFVTGTGKVYRKHPGLSSVTTENLFGLDGNGKLDGTYVRAKNSSTSDAYSASHSFQYATTNTHFDEASLYYHVDNFRRNFIEGLDSGNDLFNFIEAYAHNNVVCNNNACFNPNDGDIYFSDGYEFAKEDKVVHHEYGHAVIYDIENGILSSGGEEGAISEGTPDYFAGSFTGRSKILEYSASFAERDMSSPFYTDYSQLPTNGNGDVIVGSHRGGEFFSSILWDIRNKTGITSSEADFLVFDALYRVGGNPDFTDFKFAMIAADAAAYSGDHYVLIRNTFADKGIGTHLYPTPAAPTSLSITNIGAGSMANPTLAWTSSPAFLDYFEVWRQKKEISSGIINPVDILVGTSSTTSYTDISGTYQTLTDYEYRYYVKAVNTYGNTSYSSNYTSWVKLIAFFKRPAGKSLPETFTLNQNYPNPFNPSTQIKFELPETAEVTIKIYNIVGQEVATLVNQEMQAGFHNTSFAADNLASGVYIARLTAIGSSGSQIIREIKMQLIK